MKNKNIYLILGIIIGVVLVFCVVNYASPKNITGYALDESKLFNIGLCKDLQETKSCTPKPTSTTQDGTIRVCGSGNITKYGKTYNTPSGITGDNRCAVGSDGSSARVSCNNFFETLPNGGTLEGARWAISTICDASDYTEKCYEYQTPDSAGYCNLEARCGLIHPCNGQETFCGKYPYTRTDYNGETKTTDEDSIFKCVEINGRTCKEWQRFCIDYGCSRLPDNPNKAQCNSPSPSNSLPASGS